MTETYAIHQFELKEHFALLTRWFEARKFPVPHPQQLPPIGLVMEHDGYFVCMGFLFRTDSAVAVIAHLCSNPASPGAVRHQGLNYLIASLMKVAEDQGYKMVTCSTNLEKLKSRFEGFFGFARTDENLTNFGRLICQWD